MVENRDELVEVSKEICELLNAMSWFMQCFELVFEEDWTYTECCLEDSNRAHQIRGTFLNPQVDEERCNWANRAELLKAYRQLRALADSFAWKEEVTKGEPS